MNQRIRLLEKQCWNYQSNCVDTEKFVQLIVMECADICNKIYFDNYPDAEDFERSVEGDAIKRHFGVEQ